MSRTRWSRLALAAGLPVAVAFSGALHAQQPRAVPSRGELLYANHCVECHSTQMHWRDRRLAQDWNSLKVQVRRWQGEARLAWTEEDIDAVARHLNATIYQFPLPPRAQR